MYCDHFGPKRWLKGRLGGQRLVFKKYPADSEKEKGKSINLEEVLIGIARMAQRLAYGQAG